jgi:oligopeptide/dipeptide ABC transporter ATP-binding protein
MTDDGNGGAKAPTPLVEVEGLVKDFPVALASLRSGQLRAVDGVSLAIRKGETVGLVGESGSGKSTVARLIMRLVDPTSGTIRFDGGDLTNLRGSALRPFRRRAQMVFQDPLGSLNPRMRADELIAEPLQLLNDQSQADALKRARELLSAVGLAPDVASKYPHQLSGGQQQRVCIARALAVEPDLVVLDEATSALDVSVQAVLLNLLKRLRAEHGFAQLVISHDLSVIAFLSDRVAVMYLGEIIEVGPTREIYAAPRHPYTAALIGAIEGEPGRRVQEARLAGEIPSPLDPPSGCRLSPRCPLAQPACFTDPQTLTPVGPDHLVACWRTASGDVGLPELRSVMGLTPSKPVDHPIVAVP